jgi:glycosyltransferase involved in cell wall biosynthesis
LELDACRAGEPLVSVIMPVRDRGWCVARSIDSVLAQTYRNFELIVVDDGSTDSTVDVVKRYGAELRLIRQEHSGAYAARNAGLRHARGSLIAFADSDDSWLPGKLAAQVPLMRRRETGLVFGDTVHVTAADDAAPRTERTSFLVSPPRRGSAAEGFVSRNFVPTCTVLVRRSCLDEIGGFCETSPVSADYHAWFRIALRHELDYVDAPVATYTVHADGISFDLGRSLAARIALFSAELARAADERTQVMLRRLLFNLSLQLCLASLRGRAGSVASPLRLAAETGWRAARFRAAPWTASFAAMQLWRRAQRARA